MRMKRFFYTVCVSLLLGTFCVTPLTSHATTPKKQPQKKTQTTTKKTSNKTTNKTTKKAVIKTVKKTPAKKPSKQPAKKVIKKSSPKPKTTPKKVTSIPKPKSEKNISLEQTSQKKEEVSKTLPLAGSIQEKKNESSTPTVIPLESKLSSIAGVYRCWQYNISGGSGNCRLSPPLILSSIGTYTESSTKGTFTVSGDAITFSESKIRGAGKLIEGNKILFEYDYNGLHHTVTYLLSENETTASQTTSSPAPSTATVQTILKYPTKETSLSSIGAVLLIPEGDDLKNPKIKYSALAQYDGDKTIIGSFKGVSSTPKTGIKYIILTSTGSSEQQVGTLDLTNPTGSTIEATIAVTSQPVAAQQTVIKKTNGESVDIELLLSYPEKDHSLDSITSIEITPQGADRATTSQKYTKLAVYDGDKIVKAWFTLPSGVVYTVYTAYVAEAVNVGTLDLTTTTEKSIQKILLVNPKK